MNAFLSTAQSGMFFVIELFVGLLEILGAIVLVVTAIKCFIQWIRHGASVRLDLAQGTALALEFKMGGEVLRTVVVREWSELGILGAIIVLRGLLTFLIHWEIKNEKRDMMEEKSKEPDPVKKI